MAHNELIEKLAEHEETISKLYSLYSQRFTQQVELWGTLAWEELEHAKKIRELGEAIGKNQCSFNASAFNPKALEASLNYIRQQIEAVRTGKELTLINALSIALSIEKSIIDGKVFEAFTGFSDNTRTLIRELRKALDDHYRSIEETWNLQRHFT